MPGWPAAAGAVPHLPAVTGAGADLPEVGGAGPGDPVGQVPARLAGIVDAAVVRHGSHGYANPVMLVHAATAPNAVLRTLPALPTTLWAPSLAAAWAATAAVTAAYSSARARPAATPAGNSVADPVHRAAVSGDPHAIKFVDTAIDTYRRGGGDAVLAVAHRAIDDIDAP